MGFTWTNIPVSGSKLTLAILPEAKANIQTLEGYSEVTSYGWAALPVAGGLALAAGMNQFKAALDAYETNRAAKASCPLNCTEVCTAVNVAVNSTHYSTKNNCGTHYSSHLSGHYSTYRGTHYSSYCPSNYSTRYSVRYNTANCGCGQGV